jgi:hypothetical protein
MHIAFALFADAANLSQEGKLNILGVFDALQVAQLPAVHARATLVVRVKGRREDAGRHRVTMRWVNPRGQELWVTSGDLDIGAPPAGPGEMDLPLIAAVDLPLDMAGAYRLHVALDDQPAAEVPLQVRGGAPPIPATGMIS